MQRTTRYLTLIAVLAVVAAACGSGTESSKTTTTEAQPVAPTETTTTLAPITSEAPQEPSLTLSVTGWPELTNGFHYEGWAIIDGEPVSTGKFNVVENEVMGLDGTPIDVFDVSGLDDATTVIITIEPNGDNDTIPAETHFVAGDVVDGVAELTISHPAAIGTDFASASGTVLLATPTDSDNTNELSGIWFLEIPGPEPSLELPELPAGWKYEAWAVIDGVPTTSGTFLTGTGADESAPFSGPIEGPPFPGEDFLVNAPDNLTFPTDLTGVTIVISVEPFPDDDPAPFILKPLVGMVPDPATDHESYELGANTSDLPTGTATIG